MEIQENVSIGKKTTMRVGGEARYYAEPKTKEDIESIWQQSKELDMPVILLGGGSNSVFADSTINALVIRIQNDDVQIDGNTVTVDAGKNLAMLINELAKENLDLSALTGIPGSIGGAIYGNAGQGPQGIWLDSFVQDVTAFIDGEWKTFTKEECDFQYRESIFKHMDSLPIIWSMTLNAPSRPQQEIEKEVQKLLQKRIEAQPHIKTSGSCFKAVGGTPAWKLIDAAGLRGKKFGGIEISEKHANFLLNDGTGTFADIRDAIDTVKSTLDEPLEVEMRLYGEDGTLE